MENPPIQYPHRLPDNEVETSHYNVARFISFVFDDSFAEGVVDMLSRRGYPWYETECTFYSREGERHPDLARFEFVSFLPETDTVIPYDTLVGYLLIASRRHIERYPQDAEKLREAFHKVSVEL